MTLPAPPLPGTARTEPVVDRGAEPVQRHPGCYWDWQVGAWVTCTAIPLPRPPRP